MLELLGKQMDSLLGSKEDVRQWVMDALGRLEFCLSKTSNKYYRNSNNDIFFDPFHSGQYSLFLYFLANTIYKNGGDSVISKKLYYLNKILHSVDWYYEIELPNYFGVEHPLGSVLGRAKYSDGLFIYQGCTIGGSGGIYPSLGKNVLLHSNASILGNSQIGDNVVLSTHTVVLNQDIPSNSLVFGISPKLEIVNRNEELIRIKYFDKLFVI